MPKRPYSRYESGFSGERAITSRHVLSSAGMAMSRVDVLTFEVQTLEGSSLAIASIPMRPDCTGKMDINRSGTRMEYTRYCRCKDQAYRKVDYSKRAAGGIRIMEGR